LRRRTDEPTLDARPADVVIITTVPESSAAPTLVKLEAEISAALTERHDQLVHRIAVALVEIAVQARKATTARRSSASSVRPDSPPTCQATAPPVDRSVGSCEILKAVSFDQGRRPLWQWQRAKTFCPGSTTAIGRLGQAPRRHSNELSGLNW
jgi:hypothetical protein